MSWEIDSVHSTVSFAVRHMMVSTVRGHFNVLRGHLHIDEDKPANSWVEAEVDATSIDTHNDQRDAHLRSAGFFNTEIYPLITFKSTLVEHQDGPNYKITGDLTMHGVTKSITFEAEYSGQSLMGGVQRAGLTAKTKINRKEFGMSLGAVAEAGQVAVSEMVAIEIDLEVVQQPAAEVAAAQ
ncbi:YceI family protein [Ktedonobacter robiniae]|uniref:Polyisoprenoid-binding protein n=1 Tax=Ktedonobacter robiniae TaxID=2778365 RepID=A0ABQ3V6N1_9CHLR|nr:YceI family protein [Ktedonobacter robiniae]GHO60534.1 polyisoprenoid-binding protein [Ktedonobacter robiniae]